MTQLTHAQLPDGGQVPHSELDIRPPALWQRIYEATLTATAGAIILSNLPTEFTAWRMILYALGDTAAALRRDTVTMQLNGDSGANYDAITIAHDYPMTQLVTVARAATSVPVAIVEAGNSRANTITPVVLEFFRPTHTAWEKVGSYASVAWGTRTSDADFLDRCGWWTWRSTAAIATVTLTMTTGDFEVGSAVQLWGLT